MITALLLALTAAPGFAQDLDEEEGGGRTSGGRAGKDEVVREIVRGLYLKAGAGSSSYLASYAGIIRPVAASNMAVGMDFIDQERMSVAWEVDLLQALHNGPKFDELSTYGPIVQGDIHTFSGLGVVEASFYPTRRLGLGLRAGGGITMAPLLMEPTAYDTEVVAELWGGQYTPVHAGPLPTFGGGAALEYYTKLSHFSVGADVDAWYILNLDLALTPVGYLKYTF